MAMSNDASARRPTPLEPVALLGLGLVGSELARGWLATGRPTFGYDIAEAPRTAHLARGGTVVAGIDELFRSNCRAVTLSLPDSTIVRDVLDRHGDALAPGSLVIDTTTGEPADALRSAEQLAARGVCYVEATLVGSSRQIGAGEAIALLSGDETAVEIARDLLTPFTNRQFIVGPIGAASRMKLIVNLVLGLNRAVLAEGLALAEAAGIDLAQTLEVLRASPAASRVMDTKGPLMINRQYTPPQARLRQHRKDVALIAQLGESLSQRLPLTALHAQLLDEALAAGLGDQDNSAIREIWRQK